MDRFECDSCQLILGSARALDRHKIYSCKNNTNKTPRPDSINRTKHRSTKKTLTGDNSQALIVSNSDIIPQNTNYINKDMIREMFFANNAKQPDADSEVLKQIKALADNVGGLEKKIESLGGIGKKIETSLEKKGTPQYNNFNIDKVQIYLTDPVDFVDVLEKRFGDRKRAIDFVRSKVNKKTEGDVDLFCEIYLHGAPDTWSVSCPDKKNHIYHILKPNNGGIISDPGGIELHKIFRSNYTNTLLKLSNAYINETIKLDTNSKDYEKARDELLDVFDLGTIQEKVCELCTGSYNPFIRKLSVKFKVLEKSYELAKDFIVEE